MGKDYLGESIDALLAYRQDIFENPDVIDDSDMEVLDDIEEQVEYLKSILNKK